VLLKDDARWPWLLLVPRIEGMSEIHQLGEMSAAMLMAEIRRASHAVAAEPGVARINVGALGNVVPQLHVHVVGRWEGDAAWPGPVWGVSGAERYTEAARAGVAARIVARLV
jgi:diadenosine tetraphosphate (Ap4A) HIT family hydrolase